MKTISSIFKKKMKLDNSKTDNLNREIEIISSSTIFDISYYNYVYPDIRAAKSDPLFHYCKYGWKEGRNPSEDFDTAFYLGANPDVIASGMNPLVHWILYGREEGRRSNKSTARTSLPAKTPVEVAYNQKQDWKIAEQRFNPSVIFVSHEASRTGAPMVLLSMLRWIEANTAIEFGIIIGADGPLRDEFRKVAPCLLIDSYPPDELRNALRQFCGMNVQLVYLNTIVSGIYGSHLTFLNTAFIMHVHEMENLFAAFEQSFQATLIFCSKFVAVSEGSKEAIEKRAHGRTIEITRIAPFIDRFVDDELYSPLLCELADRIVPTIYGCGTLEYRKGPDLFCDIAEILLREGITDFRMRWIGPNANWDLASEINRRGIGSHVEWLGPQANPRRILKDGAIFVLPSREDAFPLVCLEAAEQCLPIICFDHHAGSMHSFVENDAGIVVPYLDAQQMAMAIKYLLENDERRQALGITARKKVELRHLTDAVCPQIVTLFPILLQSRAVDEFEAYKDQIDRADTISFDIFDTLITRRLSNPATVFDVIEHRHSVNQAAATAIYDERMRVAGAVLAKHNGARDDVSIDEIYNDMPFFRDARIEKEVEIDVVVAHPLGRKIYDYAVESGKKILIVSDMYLDEDTIKKMLNTCGIIYWDKLFLSSALGCKKDTGRLFDAVLAYAQGRSLLANKILHIGDNWEGDVHKAKAAGLKAIRFVPLYEQSNCKFPIGLEQTRKLSQIGRIWNDYTTQAIKLWKARNYDVSNDFYMTLGFELTGPLASMMAMYVRSRADILGIRKIVFMARDGRIIKKAFETLYRREIAQGRYDVLYAHLSRAVVVPATLQHPLSNSDRYFLIEGLHLGQKSVRYFVEKAGLDASDPEIVAKVKSTFGNMDSIPTWADLLSMNLLMEDLSARIYAANASERTKFAVYLHQLGIDQNEKIIMVDVGWLLNVQSRFHQFCRNMDIPEQAIGIYVGSRDRVDKSLPHFSLLFDGGDPRHYADMIEQNTTLFEVLFSSPEPSASGLAVTASGEVDVTLKSLSMPRPKEFEVARKLHFGAEAYFEDLATALNTFMPERISKDFFFAAFEALVDSSDIDAHREFGKFEVLLGGHHEFISHQNLMKGNPPVLIEESFKSEYFSPMDLGFSGRSTIAIITSAGLDNGSTRYRALNLGLSLSSMNIASTLYHASTEINRFEMDIVNFDTILFQRCFKDQGNVGAMYDLARQHGKRCVMEIDDLVFPEFVPLIGSVIGGEWNYAEAFFVSSAYDAMMNDMDGAITSTTEIHDFVKKKWKIPTAIYRNRVKKTGHSSSAQDGQFRIIYASGTYSHKEDFYLIEYIMRDILMKYPNVSLSLLGSTQVSDKLLSLPNVSIYPILPYQMMISFISSHQLMIVPLADSIFNHAKSNVKFIESASVGVPVLASAVHEYALGIEDGVNGLLAYTPEDWRNKLEMAISNRLEMAKIGKNSKSLIERNYLCSTLDVDTISSLMNVMYL